MPFNDPRRSRMIVQLAAIHAYGLLEPHEAAVDGLGAGGRRRGGQRAHALQPLAERARGLQHGREVEAGAGGGLQRLELGGQRAGGARVIQRQHRRVQPAQGRGQVDLGVEHEDVGLDLVDGVVLGVPPPRKARAAHQPLHGARELGVLLGEAGE